MTALAKWAPFQDFDVAERRMRRMLENLGVAPAPLPAANMYETEKALVVELDVPGFRENELTLEVSDHMLTIKGERKEEKERTDKTFFLRERLEKQFERTFKLSSDVDPEHVEATFKTGVLAVQIPKIEPAKTRKIAIKA